MIFKKYKICIDKWTPYELIKILKEYEFMENSVKSFCLKHEITEKTILKYQNSFKNGKNSLKLKKMIKNVRVVLLKCQNMLKCAFTGEKCHKCLNEYGLFRSKSYETYLYEDYPHSTLIGKIMLKHKFSGPNN